MSLEKPTPPPTDQQALECVMGRGRSFVDELIRRELEIKEGVDNDIQQR